MEAAFPIRRAIQALTHLPGVGEKTASRYAFYLLNADERIALEVGEAILALRTQIHFCKRCRNLTEDECCSICTDPKRNPRQICVVESVPALLALEASGAYRGVYHVLHGVLQPLDGIGPEALRTDLLEDRLKAGCDELIIATNPSVEGEATALFLSELAHPYNIPITRLATGVPMGADLEYADKVTLARALTGRHAL